MTKEVTTTTTEVKEVKTCHLFGLFDHKCSTLMNRVTDKFLPKLVEHLERKQVDPDVIESIQRSDPKGYVCRNAYSNIIQLDHKSVCILKDSIEHNCSSYTRTVDYSLLKSYLKTVREIDFEYEDTNQKIHICVNMLNAMKKWLNARAKHSKCAFQDTYPHGCAVDVVPMSKKQLEQARYQCIQYFNEKQRFDIVEQIEAGLLVDMCGKMRDLVNQAVPSNVCSLKPVRHKCNARTTTVSDVMRLRCVMYLQSQNMMELASRVSQGYHAMICQNMYITVHTWYTGLAKKCCLQHVMKHSCTQKRGVVSVTDTMRQALLQYVNDPAVEVVLNFENVSICGHLFDHIQAQTLQQAFATKTDCYFEKLTWHVCDQTRIPLSDEKQRKVLQYLQEKKESHLNDKRKIQKCGYVCKNAMDIVEAGGDTPVGQDENVEDLKNKRPVSPINNPAVVQAMKRTRMIADV